MSNENVTTESLESQQLSYTQSDSHGFYDSEVKLRRLASWGAVLGALVLGCCLAVVLISQIIQPAEPEANWLIAKFKEHFAGTIGIPLSALSAFCVVTLLRVTTGPIEIESQLIKFRGASGPIILWILCFVAIVGGVKLLWGCG